MPSETPKQQRFFQAVKRAKHDPSYGDERLRKVAHSMTDTDIDDFSKSLAELKTKKAVLSVLKDISEPMYLNEEDEEMAQINPIAKTFHIKDDFSKYVFKYIGQPFSPKELEAISNYQESKPTKIDRSKNEIWYETTDSFNMSSTTVIKKMKDSGQFSYNAIQKHSKAEPDEEKPQGGEMGGTMPPMSGPSEMPQGAQPPGTPTPPSTPTPQQKTQEQEKDDIIVTKSILFKDDIRGGAILADFLKKLDL